jgi:hypothetical protein
MGFIRAVAQVWGLGAIAIAISIHNPEATPKQREAAMVVAATWPVQLWAIIGDGPQF